LRIAQALNYLRQKYENEREIKSGGKRIISSYDGEKTAFSTLDLLATVFLWLAHQLSLWDVG
jgi:hypothetical protein